MGNTEEKINILKEKLRGVPPPPYITNPSTVITDFLPSLKEYFQNIETENADIVKQEEQNFDIYLNNEPQSEFLNSLYEKFRERSISHETKSFFASPIPVILPQSPMSVLSDSEFVDMLPRSLSSPVSSPVPDKLTLEFTRRRNSSSANKTKSRSSEQHTNVPIKNPRLLNVNSPDIFNLRQKPKITPHVVFRNSRIAKFFQIPCKNVADNKQKSEDKAKQSNNEAGNKSSTNTIPPENKSSTNTIPPENKSSTNTIPPVNKSSTITTPQVNKSSTNTTPPENKSSTNTIPPENKSSTNTTPPENKSNTIQPETSKDQKPILKELHKQKLKWATYTAIQKRSPEIYSNGVLLKENATKLFALCRSQWLLILKNNDHSRKESTSDRMLKIADELVLQVIK